jgi:hypothetical protein
MLAKPAKLLAKRVEIAKLVKPTELAKLAGLNS